LDINVLNFLGHLQENHLLENVHLGLADLSKAKLLPFLTHVLPLIASIDSIHIEKIHRLGQICDDACNNSSSSSNEFSKMLKTTMARARIVQTRFGQECLELGWWCRWLQTPRDDRKARMLIISTIQYSPDIFPSIVNHIKQVEYTFKKK
jgi:hypothetical protein